MADLGDGVVKSGAVVLTASALPCKQEAPTAEPARDLGLGEISSIARRLAPLVGANFEWFER